MASECSEEKETRMMNIKIMQIVLSYLFFMEEKLSRSTLTRYSNVYYAPLKEHDDKKHFCADEKCFAVIFTFFSI